jgi:hypothetical protein
MIARAGGGWLRGVWRWNIVSVPCGIFTIPARGTHQGTVDA